MDSISSSEISEIADTCRYYETAVSEYDSKLLYHLLSRDQVLALDQSRSEIKESMQLMSALLVQYMEHYIVNKNRELVVDGEKVHVFFQKGINHIEIVAQKCEQSNNSTSTRWKMG